MAKLKLLTVVEKFYHLVNKKVEPLSHKSYDTVI